MTSLPHSALVGYRSDTDRVPDVATTMAEHLHAAGYQTAITGRIMGWRRRDERELSEGGLSECQRVNEREKGNARCTES